MADRADAYVASAVHAAGADLDQVEALARAMPGARALDLGCGGGHVAYRLAPHAARGHRLRPDAGHAGRGGRRGGAAGARQRRPCSRARRSGCPSPKRRVRPGGQPVLGASLAGPGRRRCGRCGGSWRRAGGRCSSTRPRPGTPLVDSFVQAIELLRDPSHGRNYSAAEWLAGLGRAGFAPQGMVARRLRLEFAGWVARMDTPALARGGDPLAAGRGLRGGARATWRWRRTAASCWTRSRWSVLGGVGGAEARRTRRPPPRCAPRTAPP